MTITVNAASRKYDITVERGALNRAGELFSLNRKVLIVTDDGVPAEYAGRLSAQCAVPVIYTISQGEDSKSLSVMETLIRTMLENGFDRNDCVVAVGGGVVGDLSGYTAASYMRGIDFYNIPTTVLSQVDSSIGGKTAVNVGAIKNIAGAFYQPCGVIIDTELLSSLPQRQISNGLSEALKMSLTFDADLFVLFEKADIAEKMDEIIVRAIDLKRIVVEQDEKEGGLRKVLNFGHTIGHGIESVEIQKTNGLYHGECVALGMIPLCSPAVRERLIPVLEKLQLPTTLSFDPELVYAAMLHDKKFSSGKVTLIRVDEPGSYVMEKVTAQELKTMMSSFFGGTL